MYHSIFLVSMHHIYLYFVCKYCMIYNNHSYDNVGSRIYYTLIIYNLRNAYRLISIIKIFES